MRPSLFFISAVLLLVTYHLGKTLYFGSDWASSRCDKIEPGDRKDCAQHRTGSCFAP